MGMRSDTGASPLGIAHGERYEWNHPFGQVEHFCYFGSSIGGCAKVAASKSVHFGYGVELLCENAGVESSCHERLEIVVARNGVTCLAPLHKSVVVDAECEQHAASCGRGLVEVQRGKSSLSFLRSGYDYRVELHVAGGGSVRCLFEHLFQQLWLDLA